MNNDMVRKLKLISRAKMYFGHTSIKGYVKLISLISNFFSLSKVQKLEWKVEERESKGSWKTKMGGSDQASPNSKCM